MAKKQQASRAPLQPGEDTVERVLDTRTRGPFDEFFTVKNWEGRSKRFHVRAATKGEFRAKAKEKIDEYLNTSTSSWTKAKRITTFIDDVSEPAVKAARLRPNTKKRYELALSQLRRQLDGLTIGDAVRFRTLEKALQDIGRDHGAESARQARTVLSKYVLDQLIREGIIDHNPLRGISIDLGVTRKGSKPAQSHALTDAQYDAVVDHLVERDTSGPIPPGTDRRHTSIKKHEITVALAVLQAGTGLRISEALALTREDATVTQDSLAVSVQAEQSKTHRGRTVPMLDARCEKFWRERIKTIGSGDPLIPAPGDAHSHWRTDNAVKACAALYRDIGARLEDETISTMRSHAWRTVLNNRAIARGVPAEIRSAFFGHTEALNARNYTDLTDVSAMQSALAGGALDGALGA